MQSDKISHLTDFWSSDLPKTPIDILVELDNVGLLETYLKPKLAADSKHKKQDYN